MSSQRRGDTTAGSEKYACFEIASAARGAGRADSVAHASSRPAMQRSMDKIRTKAGYKQHKHPFSLKSISCESIGSSGNESPICPHLSRPRAGHKETGPLRGPTEAILL